MRTAAPLSSVSDNDAVCGILAFAPVAPVGCNQLDPVLLGERVRVVGFIADEPSRNFVEEAAGQNIFTKLALGRPSAVDRYGERKTVSTGESDDLRALAATSGAECEAPFLALAKVASTNDLAWSSQVHRRVNPVYSNISRAWRAWNLSGVRSVQLKGTRTPKPVI